MIAKLKADSAPSTTIALRNQPGPRSSATAFWMAVSLALLETTKVPVIEPCRPRSPNSAVSTRCSRKGTATVSPRVSVYLRKCRSMERTTPGRSPMGVATRMPSRRLPGEPRPMASISAGENRPSTASASAAG